MSDSIKEMIHNCNWWLFHLKLVKAAQRWIKLIKWSTNFENSKWFQRGWNMLLFIFERSNRFEICMIKCLLEFRVTTEKVSFIKRNDFHVSLDWWIWVFSDAKTQKLWISALPGCSGYQEIKASNGTANLYLINYEDVRWCIVSSALLTSPRTLCTSIFGTSSFRYLWFKLFPYCFNFLIRIASNCFRTL